MPTIDLLHSHSPFYIFVFCGRASTHPIDEKKKPSPSSRRFCSSKRTVSPKRKREIARLRREKKLSSLLLSAEFYRRILLNTLITELQSRQRSPLPRKEAYPLPLIRTDLWSAIDRTNDRRQREDVVSLVAGAPFFVSHSMLRHERRFLVVEESRRGCSKLRNSRCLVSIRLEEKGGWGQRNRFAQRSTIITPKRRDIKTLFPFVSRRVNLRSRSRDRCYPHSSCFKHSSLPLHQKWNQSDLFDPVVRERY